MFSDSAAECPVCKDLDPVEIYNSHMVMMHAVRAFFSDIDKEEAKRRLQDAYDASLPLDAHVCYQTIAILIAQMVNMVPGGSLYDTLETWEQTIKAGQLQALRGAGHSDSGSAGTAGS